MIALPTPPTNLPALHGPARAVDVAKMWAKAMTCVLVIIHCVEEEVSGLLVGGGRSVMVMVVSRPIWNASADPLPLAEV